MTTRRNALALGLAATVIFSAGAIRAQQFIFPLPSEILVTRIGDALIFSSNPLEDPTGVCAFDNPIHVLAASRGQFPSIAALGEEQADGSLVVDRGALLAVLDSQDAVFALFCTTCGSNTGEYGAKALRARVGLLEDGESTTIHTVYYTTAPCSGDV